MAKLFKRIAEIFAPKRTVIRYENLSPEQKAAFDRAFKKLDEAADELRKAWP